MGSHNYNTRNNSISTIEEKEEIIGTATVFQNFQRVQLYLSIHADR